MRAFCIENVGAFFLYQLEIMPSKLLWFVVFAGKEDEALKFEVVFHMKTTYKVMGLLWAYGDDGMMGYELRLTILSFPFVVLSVVVMIQTDPAKPSMETRITRTWVNKIFPWHLDIRAILKQVDTEYKNDGSVAIFKYETGAQNLKSRLGMEIRPFLEKNHKRRFMTRRREVEKDGMTFQNYP
jgi:hypothetical protein